MATTFFGQIIRKERERNSISLRGLAKQVGITPSFLSDIELDRRRPSLQTLERLCDALTMHLPSMMIYCCMLRPSTKRFLEISPNFVAAVEKLADSQRRWS